MTTNTDTSAEPEDDVTTDNEPGDAQESTEVTKDAEPADDTVEVAEVDEAEATTEADDSADTDETDEADEADEADEEKNEAEDPTEGSGGGLRRWLVVGLVAAAFVAVLAGAGFFGWKWWQATELTKAGESAREAAVAYAQVLTSIDSDKVDENFIQVLDGSTGEFKDMYTQSSVQLRQLLIDNKASAHGVVVESAVQSVKPDQVVVLLFVDQSVSNVNMPDPRIDRSRIKMTMDYVDGRWRASKVELP